MEATRRSRWRQDALGATLIALTVLVALFAMNANAQASSHRDAIIHADTVTGGASSQEAVAAVANGFDVDVVSNTVWQTMTAADFGAYDLIIIGDDTCDGDPATAAANASVWAPVVMGTAGGRTQAGNRVVVGTDPVYHGRSVGHARTAILRDGIAFAGIQTGRTGLYFSTSCNRGGDSRILGALEALSTGTGSWTAGSPPCGGSVSLIAAHPSFSTVTTSSLQGWGCSVHASWPTFPTDWSALAVATDVNPKPTCGVDPNTGLSACGQAYILVAGSGIVVVSGSIAVSPLTATNPVGTTHVVTAHVTSDGSDLVGEIVDFTVTGVNGGTSGTCIPASCESDASGMVSFTYLGDGGEGDDTIKASFTDAGGSLQSATAAKTWEAVANADPEVEANKGSVTAPEGSAATNSGTVSDTDGETVTLSASEGTVVNNGDGTWNWSNAAPDGPDAYSVTIGADDGNGGTASTTFGVTITNVAPSVDAGTDVTVDKNEIAGLVGSFTDPAGTADEAYAWSWTVTGDSGSAAYGDTLPTSFSSATSGDFDLTLTVVDKDGGSGSDTVRVIVVNQAPSCTDAAPSIAEIWPPNHKMVDVSILGVTDADGDAITITIDSIFQDEPVNTNGDGNTDVDGAGVGSDTAQVRAERSGSKKVPGDGRAYHIGFTASDGEDDCSGSVVVRVPHDQGKKTVFVDGGAIYDSTAP